MEKAGKVMEEVDKVVDKREELTQPMSTPKKSYGALGKVVS